MFNFLKPGWWDEARSLAQRAVFRKILRNSSALAGRCLNAGSGEGLYTPWLGSQKGITSIVQLDIQPPRGADLGVPCFSVQGSLSRLPFEENAFDSCLCSEVLEHLSEDVEAVSELSRVLKPGGVLLLSTPTPPAPRDPAHLREGYARGELGALLVREGLLVTRHQYCFYLSMRVLYHVWQWQFRVLGRRNRSLFPRFLLRLFALLDQRIPVGKPWDLVLLAEKPRASTVNRA